MLHANRGGPRADARAGRTRAPEQIKGAARRSEASTRSAFIIVISAIALRVHEYLAEQPSSSQELAVDECLCPPQMRRQRGNKLCTFAHAHAAKVCVFAFSARAHTYKKRCNFELLALFMCSMDLQTHTMRRISILYSAGVLDGWQAH